MAEGSNEEAGQAPSIGEGGGTPSAHTQTGLRKGPARRRFIPLALVGAMSIGAAAGAVAGVVGSPTIPGVGQSPIAFVISSAHATVAQRTADIVFAGTISSKGKSVPMTGTGQADFTRNAFAGSVHFPSHGYSVVEDELSVDNAYYLAVVVDGVNTAQYLSGKHWIRIPQPSTD
jgi:hypothetical protein